MRYFIISVPSYYFLEISTVFSTDWLEFLLVSQYLINFWKKEEIRIENEKSYFFDFQKWSTEKCLIKDSKTDLKP